MVCVDTIILKLLFIIIIFATRKEIGATRWQYGGSGKLHGYKSASDLKEPHGLTLETATQRRRRAKVVAHRPGFCAGRPSMISHPDDSSSADESPTDMANYPDRCSTRYTPGSKQSKRNRRINNKHSTLSSTSAKENDVQDLFPMDPLKIDELKHKVLEKVGARVIKRPSPHSAKSNDDASSESHLKNEHSSLKVKPSPHRSKLSCKQGHQGYPNIQSESANQPCDGLQSKHISSTKSPMMKNIIEPLQENFVVSVNCDKQDKVCATEKRSIQTSDYSSDIETFSDKVEESVPFSGFNSNHNAFSPLCSNESDSGAGKHMSRNNVEHSSVNNRKCLSDDVEDTPILGIKSVFSASSASSLSERNVSKQDCSLQTKENAKPDHDVEVWLRNIGLKNCDKYVELFARHEIEMSCLKYLTAELLNQMGITAVGPVNKILIAILNLEEYMPTPGSHAERHRTPTPASNTQTLSSSAATCDSLIQTPRPMSEDSISFADRSTPCTPILTPKVKDCIPEFTSDLQKKYKDMNVEHGKVNVQNEFVKCDNVKENLSETYTIKSETSQQKSKTYIIKSETSQPKSKTLMTKRSCSASRVVADDRPAGKPRTQSRSANVSTARQRDSLSSKREGKKEKVQTSGERSITSRSSAPNKLTTDIVQKKADIGMYTSRLSFFSDKADISMYTSRLSFFSDKADISMYTSRLSFFSDKADIGMYTSRLSFFSDKADIGMYTSRLSFFSDKADISMYTSRLSFLSDKADIGMYTSRLSFFSDKADIGMYTSRLSFFSDKADIGMYTSRLSFLSDKADIGMYTSRLSFLSDKADISMYTSRLTFLSDEDLKQVRLLEF